MRGVKRVTLLWVGMKNNDGNLYVIPYFFRTAYIHIFLDFFFRTIPVAFALSFTPSPSLQNRQPFPPSISSCPRRPIILWKFLSGILSFIFIRCLMKIINNSEHFSFHYLYSMIRRRKWGIWKRSRRQCNGRKRIFLLHRLSIFMTF